MAFVHSLLLLSISLWLFCFLWSFVISSSSHSQSLWGTFWFLCGGFFISMCLIFHRFEVVLHLVANLCFFGVRFHLFVGVLQLVAALSFFTVIIFSWNWLFIFLWLAFISFGPFCIFLVILSWLFIPCRCFAFLCGHFEKKKFLILFCLFVCCVFFSSFFISVLSLSLCL